MTTSTQHAGGEIAASQIVEPGLTLSAAFQLIEESGKKCGLGINLRVVFGGTDA